MVGLRGEAHEWRNVREASFANRQGESYRGSLSITNSGKFMTLARVLFCASQWCGCIPLPHLASLPRRVIIRMRFRLVVPLTAGGATDLVANLIGQCLSQRGQPVAVEHQQH